MYGRKVFLAVIIIGIMFTAANAQSKFGNRVPAQAAPAKPATQSSETPKVDAAGIEGTWRGNPDIFADTKSLYTFSAGGNPHEGTAIHHSNFSFVPSPSCINEQGVWREVTHGSFISTVEAFCWDSNKGFAPAGMVRIRAAFTLSHGGMEFDGTTQIELFDVDGNLLFTETGPLHAVRMQAQAPAP